MRIPSISPLLFVAACVPCSMESTFPGFEPTCNAAVLRRYPEEARLAIPAPDGVLVAYLPPDLVAGTKYGGTSGNSLMMLLDDRLAESRGTTLSLWAIDRERATGELQARFEEGEVSGDFIATVEGGG